MCQKTEREGCHTVGGSAFVSQATGPGSIFMQLYVLLLMCLYAIKPHITFSLLYICGESLLIAILLLLSNS